MYYKPYDEQKVAITGSWCQALPDASHDLSHAVYCFCYNHELHDMHRTIGDDMTITMEETAKHLENLWRAHFGCHVHGVTLWDEASVDLEHVADHLKALCRDVFGRHVCGVTLHVADSIVADLRTLAALIHGSCMDTFKCMCFFFSYGFRQVLCSISESNDSRHLFHDVGQVYWETKRQQTKQRRKANSKTERAKAERQRKAGMRRSCKASLTR